MVSEKGRGEKFFREPKFVSEARGDTNSRREENSSS